MAQDGGLRTLIRDHLPPNAHMQSIETGGTGRGIPDLNICHNGVEVWVECKLTDTTNAGLRPEQVAWCSRRTRAGGRVFIAVRQKHAGGPRKGEPIDKLWIVPSATIEALATTGLSPFLPGALVTAGGPRNWAWDAIRSLLLNSFIPKDVTAGTKD